MGERIDIEYVNKQELAARTGFSPATIQRLKDRGLIPFYQPGGKGSRVTFPSNAIERLAADEQGGMSSGAPFAEQSRTRIPGPQPRWRRHP